jgi:thiol-disulfide isomerase/thioredoxin
MNHSDMLMYSYRLRSLALALVLVTTSSGWTHAAQSKAAPDVALQNVDGTALHLSAYTGKVVLVDFWASWCVSCKKSFPALDTIYGDYHARGLEVVAVNLDEKRRDADAFLDRYPHHLTVLFDPTALSAVKFGVKGMPTSFLIDKTGTIRFTHVGYSGDVAETYRREIAQLLAEH